MNLFLVTAHPDDETIFFGRLLLELGPSITHVCLTHGNDERSLDMNKATRQLVRNQYCFDLPDLPSFSLAAVNTLLEGISEFRSSDFVVTHNPDGEYGHKGHQSISHIISHLVNADRLLVPSFNPLYFSEKYYQLKSQMLMSYSSCGVNLSRTRKYDKYLYCEAPLSAIIAYRMRRRA